MGDPAEISFSKFGEVNAREIVRCAISDLAKLHGLSLSRIREQSGVGWNSVVDMANGRANPTLETIDKIAKVFNMDYGGFIIFGFHALLEIEKKNHEARQSEK